MRSASPKLRRFARRILALETTSSDTEGTGSAAFFVSERLRRPLSMLVGAAGFRSLLSRALALANDEVYWLKVIRVSADGSLQGLDDVRGELSQAEMAKGEVVLIAQLVGLLVTFVGEALTVRLLQDVWPEISARDLDSETEKDHG
jgi:hypothetical protein